VYGPVFQWRGAAVVVYSKSQILCEKKYYTETDLKMKIYLVITIEGPETFIKERF
jgi:hypothetical protein